MKVLHIKTKDKKTHNEGIAQKDKRLKKRDEGIAKTQCSNLQEMKLTLKKTISITKP